MSSVTVPSVVGRPEILDPVEALRIGVERHHPHIAQACSFQAEAIVLIDMLMQVRGDVRIFSLDTGRLPEETYEVADQVRRRWGDIITWYHPDADAVEELVNDKGMYSFRDSIENRKECCFVRKVEPMQRAMEGLSAWISGLRWEQSNSRRQVGQFEQDSKHVGLEKINPIVHWTTQDVWEYIVEHDLPYNRLYEQGYTQIGCAPCTRSVRPGDDPRAGRWWWETDEHKECGLHIGGSGI